MWTDTPTDEHKREHGHGRYGQAVLDVGDSCPNQEASTLGQEHVEHHSPPVCGSEIVCQVRVCLSQLKTGVFAMK